jgi:hypothetical protein
MNSAAQERRISPQRRILPIRSSNMGVRTGMTGAYPMGPDVGDQQQWVLPPKVRLTTREKRMVAAMAMKIAILVLFHTPVN